MRRIDVDTIGTGALAEDVLVERRAATRSRARRQRRDLPAAGRAGRVRRGRGHRAAEPAAGLGRVRRRRHAGRQAHRDVQRRRRRAARLRVRARRHAVHRARSGSRGSAPRTASSSSGSRRTPASPARPARTRTRTTISTNFCKLATDLGTAGRVAADAQGRIYVAESSGLRIDRFSPPFPTGPNAAGGCGRRRRDRRAARRLRCSARCSRPRPQGMLDVLRVSRSRRTATSTRRACSPAGSPSTTSTGTSCGCSSRRRDTSPPIPTGNPQGIAVGADGTVYYADLDLRGTLPERRTRPERQGVAHPFQRRGRSAPARDRRGRGSRSPTASRSSRATSRRRTRRRSSGRRSPAARAHVLQRRTRRRLTAQTAPQLIERWRFPTERGHHVVADGRDRRPARSAVGRVSRSSRRGTATSTRSTGRPARSCGASRGRTSRARRSRPRGSPTVTDVDGTPCRARRRGRDAVRARRRDRHRTVALRGRHRLPRPADRRPTRDCAPSPASATRSSRRRSSSTASRTSAWTSTTSRRGKGGFYAVDVDGRHARVVLRSRERRRCAVRTRRDEIAPYDGYHSEAELGLPAGFLADAVGL